MGACCGIVGVGSIEMGDLRQVGINSFLVMNLFFAFLGKHPTGELHLGLLEQE